MTTETIERTLAAERKAKAAEQLKKLESEQAHMRTRKQEMTASLEQLQREIVRCERACTDQDAKELPGIRTQRLEQQQILEDLDGILPTFARDLEVARAELRAAEVAVQADAYNDITTQQRDLTKLLNQTIDTLLTAIRTKEHLAGQQDKISGGIRPYANQSPAGVRHAYLHFLTERLQNELPETSRRTSLQSIDWSCRRMRADGDLEEAR